MFKRNRTTRSGNGSTWLRVSEPGALTFSFIFGRGGGRGRGRRERGYAGPFVRAALPMTTASAAR